MLHRATTLLAALLACISLAAQPKDEYVQPHFKVGQTIRYNYRFTCDSHNPQTGLPIKPSASSLAMFWPIRYWTYMTGVVPEDTIETEALLTVREATPHTYTMGLRLTRICNLIGKLDADGLLFYKICEKFFSEHEILLTFSSEMTNCMPIRITETMSQFADALWDWRNSDPELAESMQKFPDKEELRKDLCDSEIAGGVITFILHLSCPTLDTLPQIYGLTYTMGHRESERKTDGDNPTTTRWTQDASTDSRGNLLLTYATDYTLPSADFFDYEDEEETDSGTGRHDKPAEALPVPIHAQTSTTFSPDGWMTHYENTTVIAHPNAAITLNETITGQIVRP